MTPIPTVVVVAPAQQGSPRRGAQRRRVEAVVLEAVPASRSAVGVAHGPPNALEAAKPTSSSKMTSTLGAPAGGRSGSIGGNFASGSFASKGNGPSVRPVRIGSTPLWIWEELNSYRLARARFAGAAPPVRV
jgi:hypothetical protein